jgi:hypothetical protein
VYRRDGCQTERKEHQAEPGKPRFSQPLDHATENSAANHDPHSAQIHDEIADVALRNRKAVGEEQRERRRGPVKCPDCDGVNPDQSLRRLLWTGDDAPYRARARLVDAVFTSDRHFFA